MILKTIIWKEIGVVGIVPHYDVTHLILKRKLKLSKFLLHIFENEQNYIGYLKIILNFYLVNLKTSPTIPKVIFYTTR